MCAGNRSFQSLEVFVALNVWVAGGRRISLCNTVQVAHVECLTCCFITMLRLNFTVVTASGLGYKQDMRQE